ncbi:hypothetical protein [Paraburkholderia sp. J67]|uniref:hypothetical protein n=1 Tax=Paraburkholderia sp. J67 TaxID=2805435 RepID=UPI002ABE22D5|nr:hypothetical protein [Paraburkholderia sp. J67]
MTAVVKSRRNAGSSNPLAWIDRIPVLAEFSGRQFGMSGFFAVQAAPLRRHRSRHAQEKIQRLASRFRPARQRHGGTAEEKGHPA